MVQKIDLKGKVFEFLQKNNLMIEESQHSNTNQNGRHEEWMFRRDTPDDWSDENLDGAWWRSCRMSLQGRKQCSALPHLQILQHSNQSQDAATVSYTHLRAHET